MSWFSGTVPGAELDNKIEEATSESIPNGEIELSIGLEITDVIKSKKIPAKQCMRSLKKRLQLVQQNPNLVKLTLQLLDLCVKNGGYHFLLEIVSKEFLDYFVDVLFKIHYDVRDLKVKRDINKYEVGCFIFTLLKNWSIYFKGQLQLQNAEKYFKKLLQEGYDPTEIRRGSMFEEPVDDGNGVDFGFEFIDTEVPPDWVDSDECMICYNSFSVINRKHHCRSCGGVYCQTHSSKLIPLVGLGIMEPVRVCDNCYEKVKHKNKSSSQEIDRNRSVREGTQGGVDEDDEDLRKAIEMSLKESQIEARPPNYPHLKQHLKQHLKLPQQSWQLLKMISMKR